MRKSPALISLDPLSPIISRVIGSIQVSARHYDEALAVCKRAGGVRTPHLLQLMTAPAYAYWGKRMYPQVVEEWNMYGQVSGYPMIPSWPPLWTRAFVPQDGKALLT